MSVVRPPSLPRKIEDKWSALWAKHNYATSHPNPKKPPFTILMPPPNITGILHMGHVLNNTVQDVVARHKRMAGHEVCWVPGTDHASIATEAKVVARLKTQGRSKKEIGRTAFLQEAHQWKEEHESIILTQLKRLGISCDWQRLAFTMDPPRSASVIQTFVKLYEEGYIYRGMRMIHWDPRGKTALADEEVLYREVQGHLYHIRYHLTDGTDSIVIATTRPETLLGDTAICVHPDDTRYHHLHGKKAYVPFLKRPIPIIPDPYVDPALGTGALKVTPAHDPNDYLLGEKHHLERIDIFNEAGELNQAAGPYAGLSREAARQQIVADLAAQRDLVKKEPHTHQVGFSERTDAIVEPRLSTQWFVRMEALAQPAIDAVKNGDITFYPAKYVKTYLTWMENIKEWCISRQLWWGHRIPVYFLPDHSYVVAATAEEALTKANAQREGKPPLTLKDLRQDEDVLDTWFSSWLWPLSVFDGIRHPDNQELQYYYPTAYLVTAPEIIFFWVARMIMAGYYYQKKAPFHTVYFTGIVRDPQRRKMSKSLGNSPDPLALMDRYGVDAVRAGILFASPAGNDLLFDEKLCQQGHQFVHKMKNALYLLQSWQKVDTTATPKQEVAMAWFHARYQEVLQEVNRHLSTFRLSEALMTLYRLLWDDFCAHYLEMIKPTQDKTMPTSVVTTTEKFFRDLMKLLHPFMPFVTEEIASQLPHKEEAPALMVASWPTEEPFDASILEDSRHAFALLRGVRHCRKSNRWSRQQMPTLVWKGPPAPWLHRFRDYILAQGGLKEIREQQGAEPGDNAFIIEGHTFWFVGIQDTAEKSVSSSYAEELAYQKKFLARVQKKLHNPHFVSKAKPQVVALERKKEADAQRRIKALEEVMNEG